MVKKIIHVLPPFLAVSSDMEYGGIERRVVNIARQQRIAGFDVGIIATSDSSIDNLIPTVKSIGVGDIYHNNIPQDVVRNNTWYKLEHVAKVMEYDKKLNDVFFHVHDDYLLAFLRFFKNPYIFTVCNDYMYFWDAKNHPEVAKKAKNIVAMSNSQKRILESHGYDVFAVVYSDIDCSNFDFSDKKDDFLLSLSVIAPHKGQDIAITVAKENASDLVIAGNIGDSEYFEKKIKQNIDYDISDSNDKYATYLSLPKGQKIVYVGAVNDFQKRPLFSKASAFLAPFLLEEPFPGVVLESLASGTPVITFNNGTMPEVIVSGKNGFLCSTSDDMVTSLRGLSQISYLDCRKSVERFSLPVIANEYLILYDSVLKNQK